MLHSNVPVALVDSVELPQLSTSVTEGAEGIALGEAVPEPAELVHPPEDWVTVYVPAAVTVIDVVVAALLHSTVPVALLVSIDEPQLSTTVTSGAEGIEVFTVMLAEPVALLAPLQLVTLQE